MAPQVAEKVATLERNIESAIGHEKVRSLIEALMIIRDLKL